MTTHFSSVFEHDKQRCVYCGRWMLADFDTFMLTEEDHLLPVRHGGNDNDGNRVTACRVCNMLKHDYVPEGGADLLQENKGKYLQLVRDHIALQRSKKLAEYFSWIQSKKRD
ncbi:MAG: HNH endonuclease signature motif containing protein [bacterium]